MEDKLDIIFRMQKELNDYIIKTRGLEFTKEEWLQKRSIALLDETIEMLREANYKWWKNAKPIDEPALKEELVDMLHFFVGLCIDAGLSADEMYQIYLNKNKENYDRQIGISNKKGYSLDE